MGVGDAGSLYIVSFFWGGHDGINAGNCTMCVYMADQYWDMGWVWVICYMFIWMSILGKWAFDLLAFCLCLLYLFRLSYSSFTKVILNVIGHYII